MSKFTPSRAIPATVRQSKKIPRIATKRPRPAAVAKEVAAPRAQKVGVQPASKIDGVIALLRRREGASIEDLMGATGWQAHSVRGAISGAIKKKLGLNVTSEKTDKVRLYRIANNSAG